MSFIFTTSSSSTSRKEKVADWAGTKKRHAKLKSQQKQQQQKEEEDSWKEVHSNIKQMDQIYDATFYAWLKSEENVLVTSIYLHRIANENPLERIINALEWLTSDWRWESTSILIRHMTVDWCDDDGDLKRAELLRKLTSQWATHYTATMISTILMTSPYIDCCMNKRETFLREFTKEYDFSKLSEFFMFLRSRTNIDNKFKCMMLQETARKDVLLSASSNKQDATVHTPVATPFNATTQHHRRTSSNDFQDIKRSILEDNEDSVEPFNRCYPTSSSASTAAAVNSSSSSCTTNSRYLHHARLSTSSSTITMTTASSSSSNPENLMPSPSTSTSNINNDKKKITVI